MGVSVVTSSAAHSRIRHARAWLETRSPAEEILILAATADAGNELARDVARTKGAAFGWHRLSLAQFAAPGRVEHPLHRCLRRSFSLCGRNKYHKEARWGWIPGTTPAFSSWAPCSREFRHV
jgi:hypothetical protein